MTDRVVYEQPLNERVRGFLRLEHLFRRFRHYMALDDEWASRVAVETLIEVAALTGRIDLRHELSQELERHCQTLRALERDPRVDHGRLAATLGRLQELAGEVRGAEAAFGSELRNHELLNAVRQRVSIPAGTCEFDLPAYRYWLLRPAEQRRQELGSWLATYAVPERGIEACLALIRESAVANRVEARAGFYQQTLEGANPYQLVRVVLPADAPFFPEISAGKHRFTVRFLQPEDTGGRATQTGADVAFELQCCAL